MGMAGVALDESSSATDGWNDRASGGGTAPAAVWGASLYGGAVCQWVTM
jgi:hypothetical protein